MSSPARSAGHMSTACLMSAWLHITAYRCGRQCRCGSRAREDTRGPGCQLLLASSSLSDRDPSLGQPTAVIRSSLQRGAHRPTPFLASWSTVLPLFFELSPRSTHLRKVNIGAQQRRGLVGFFVAVVGGVVVAVEAMVAVVTVVPVAVPMVTRLVALVGHRGRLACRAGGVVDERRKWSGRAVERPRTKGGKAASGTRMYAAHLCRH